MGAWDERGDVRQAGAPTSSRDRRAIIGLVAICLLFYAALQGVPPQPNLPSFHLPDEAVLELVGLPLVERGGVTYANATSNLFLFEGGAKFSYEVFFTDRPPSSPPTWPLPGSNFWEALREGGVEMRPAVLADITEGCLRSLLSGEGFAVTASQLDALSSYVHAEIASVLETDPTVCGSGYDLTEGAAGVASMVLGLGWLWAIVDAARRGRYGWMIAIILFSLIAVPLWLMARHGQPLKE